MDNETKQKLIKKLIGDYYEVECMVENTDKQMGMADELIAVIDLILMFNPDEE